MVMMEGFAMTLLTPALLFFVPLWASAALLNIAMAQNPVSLPQRAPKLSSDEDGPEHWVAMPFTPPSVHAA